MLEEDAPELFNDVVDRNVRVQILALEVVNQFRAETLAERPTSKLAKYLAATFAQGALGVLASPGRSILGPTRRPESFESFKMLRLATVESLAHP